MPCWCSFTDLVFILNSSFDLVAEYADLVTIISGSFLLSAISIDLMKFSPLAPE